MKVVALALLLWRPTVSALCGGRHFTHEKGMGGYPYTETIGDRKIDQIRVAHGDHIDSIKFVYNGETDSFYGGDDESDSFYGGYGGRDRSSFVIPEDDVLDKVRVWADRGTNGIQFKTKKGTKSAVYGRKDGEQKVFSSEGNGFSTVELRSGQMVDKIEFIPASGLKDYEFTSDNFGKDVENADERYNS